MIRSPIRVALGTVAVALLTLRAPVASQEYAYVASQQDATVAVIDMSDHSLRAIVDLKTMGFDANARPHGTAVEPDGSFWYVSLIGAGAVLKLDRENRLVGRAAFETPGILALDPGSRLLYVGRSMAAVNPPSRIGVIDRETMELEEIDVFAARPHALVVDPVGSRFFTASLAENRIAYGALGSEEVDLLRFERPVHTLVQMAVSPDGHWLVGGGQVSGDLLVFDISGPEPRYSHSVHLGGQPWHPSFAPDGATLWVPTLASDEVKVLETDTWAVSSVIRHPAIAQPHGSVFSPDGRTAYVSSRNLEGSYAPPSSSGEAPGTVIAIDVTTREVLTVLEVGPYAAGMSAPAPAR